MRRTELLEREKLAILGAEYYIAAANIKSPGDNAPFWEKLKWNEYITSPESLGVRKEAQRVGDQMEVWLNHGNPFKSNDKPSIKVDLTNPDTWPDKNIPKNIGDVTKTSIEEVKQDFIDVTKPVADVISVAAGGVGSVVQGLANVPSKIAGGLENFMTILAIGVVGIGGLIIYGEYKNITK